MGPQQWCRDLTPLSRVQLIAGCMGGLEVRIPDGDCTASDTLYICVDNSNMHIGAQKGFSSIPGGPVPEAVPVVHLQYKNLVDKVVRGRPTAWKFVGGVMPDAVARNWREQSFAVKTGAAVRASLPAKCMHVVGRLKCKACGVGPRFRGVG